MKKRIQISCAVVSLTAFLVSMMLTIYVWTVNPNPLKHWSYVRLGGEIHVAVINRWGSNVVFYNEDMPYLGDVISVDDRPKISERGWSGCGIYLRLIKNIDIGATWWTFMISLWYPIVFFSISSVICLFVLKNARRQKERVGGP
jgi:hypothetical protein